jgi:serine/threonine protein kinase
VSGSGHLKIADFGLATSGEWIYQESYRSSRRQDLLRKYHQAIVDDGLERINAVEISNDEPKSKLRDRLNKMNADSVVGTYYYMAPEVLRGESYNATADWSVSLISSDEGGHLELSYSNACLVTHHSGQVHVKPLKRSS